VEIWGDSLIRQHSKIFVAGHLGMVGSAIVRKLLKDGFENLLTVPRQELDLMNQLEVFDFLQKEKPDAVVMAAAKVGGIHANNAYPAEFIYENLAVQNNLIHGAHLADIQHLLFLGSSCIYPKFASQPMCESALLSGELELTNQPYAVAKIAGIKMCESYNRQYGRDYRSVMPTNLYGPNDNFHPENSHVIPAMMRRFHLAKLNGDKQVVVWGTGKARREFLHVDDMASASVFLMSLTQDIYQANTEPMLSHINAGRGKDCTIEELAHTMSRVVGFEGEIVFDISKPDGPPRKLLDVSRLRKMGWSASISLQKGLTDTYQWFLEYERTLRKI
jgi:GDP-L-fucose synthase